MKYIIVFLILTVLFSPQLIAAQECNTKNLIVSVQLAAFDENRINEISRYQHPYYKEGDILMPWIIEIKNVGECTSVTQILKLTIKLPNETENMFCTNSIGIPPLKPNQIYSIFYSSYNERIIDNGFSLPEYIYRDSNDNTFGLTCTTQLLFPGVWKFEPSMEEKYINETQAGSVVWNIKNIFKVKEETELLSLEQQNFTIILSVVAIVISIVVGLSTILTMFYVAKWQINKQKRHEEETQKELLKSIRVWLRLVREATEEQKKIFSKNKNIVPTWIIPEIDSSLFVTRLRHFINNHETTDLKKLIIETASKARDINNTLDFVKISDISQNKKSTDSILKMIRENKYQFHSHLIQLTKEIEKELEIIEDDSH
jgi:hypothetical protein